MPTPTFDLSLVLACYNEAAVIESSVQQILETLDHSTFSYEIIFVDDCSRDRTRDLIEQIIAAHPQKRLSRIFHAQNMGRGATVADGLRAARGDVVGYIDIDLEVHARYIPACVLAVRRGADVVIGQRTYLFQPRAFHRWLMSKVYHWLAATMLRVPLPDTESGYKFFKRDKILPVLDEIQDARWFWDTEVVVRSSLRGYRIAEIPVLFLRRYNKHSTVNPLADATDYFLKLWRFSKMVRAWRKSDSAARMRASEKISSR